MPYPPRSQFAGATYHIFTRATGPSAFFRAPYDYRGFLIILARAVEKYGLLLHAYCLMVTHYHLVVTTPQPTIARAMQYLNSIYARAFNQRYGRLGHFVAARYSSPLIETQGHAYEVSRYVPLNPVRAEFCDLPEEYPWSSYAATIGLREEPTFLDSAWVLGLFDEDFSTARRTYRDFVEAARVSETSELRQGRELSPRERWLDGDELGQRRADARRR
jgi:REP-associated tyrosine transposase